MKRTLRLLVSVGAAALLLVACQGILDNEAPVVAILTPADGSTVQVGDTVDISGSSSDNGQVRQVSVTVGGEHLTTTVPDETGAWSVVWQPAEQGDTTITATAVDAGGKGSNPASVTVTVTGDPTVPGSVTGTLRREVPEAPAAAGPAASARGSIEPGQLFIAFANGRPEVQLGTASADLDAAAAEGFSFRADGSFSYQGLAFSQARAYPVESGLALYTFPGLSEAETWDLAEELERRSTVRAAIPNLIVHSQQVTPDDPLYAYQAWHYEQLNLPNAWELEDGASAPVHVAVLDTGSYPHPDIAWAATGVNLVNFNGVGPSEGAMEDPGTIFPGSPHGTHVAGTIGALTNNGDGVAGVNWHLEPIPVKVLGQTGSGNFAGVFEGLFWAAGFDFDYYDGHVNPNPAQVANLSLGGLWGDVCPPEFNEIFELVYQLTGMVTVVAAGNDGSPANPFMPAACDAVITVGATGPTGARAYYSNYGSQVDVFAPGGDADYPHPHPDFSEITFAGVLSTDWDVANMTDAPSYGFNQGTSMAAPHVAGVVSLMLAQDPGLSREEIRERLHAASYPLTETECGFVAPGLAGLNQCGAGLLDAEAALLGIEVLATTASVWAVPFSGGDAPEIGYSNLGDLDLITSYRASGTAQADGSFEFEFTDLPPGSYVLVGLEQRNADTGVGTTDRLATQVIELEAGGAVDVELEVTPLYLLLR